MTPIKTSGPTTRLEQPDIDEAEENHLKITLECLRPLKKKMKK